MADELQRARRGTVLLAEGDVLVRMPIAQYLRDCGYRVVEAVTKEEAIRALGAARLDVSVVLSSVELAGDGFGISSWIKKHRPDLNVILTGTPKRAVDAASQLCSDESVPTRLAPQILLRRIQQMLASRRVQKEGRTAM
jgi:DNA-binding NtrC family response regulator